MMNGNITKQQSVFIEWSPYGSPGPEIQKPDTAANNAAYGNNVVFREWSPSSQSRNEEVEKVEQEMDKIRRHLHQLREHGRQLRLHRLQALDALETRRVTLTEILRRMEKELNDRDVYEYGDVLAEVFGERKIYAHRAIGLEALLCQYMHQMLAKQHQLKIMKRAGKDIEGHYRRCKHNNKDEFHSYDALCVQLEASRLTLEDFYDDIFASQHRILAQLKRVKSGGEMTNYSIPSPAYAMTNNETKVTLSSNQTDLNVADKSALRASLSGDKSSNDVHSAFDTLFIPTNKIGNVSDDEDRRELHIIKTASETAAAILANPSLRTISNTKVLSASRLTVSTASTEREGDRPTTSRRSSDDGKTARERRREIEKRRMAQPFRIASTKPSNNQESQHSFGSTMSSEDDVDASTVIRNRMREIEAKAKQTGLASTASKSKDEDDEVE